jgi:hypothetical protein
MYKCTLQCPPSAERLNNHLQSHLYIVWRMQHGVYRMAYGIWRMAYGVWRMEIWCMSMAHGVCEYDVVCGVCVWRLCIVYGRMRTVYGRMVYGRMVYGVWPHGVHEHFSPTSGVQYIVCCSV